ncbi:hypothetical protein [Aquimarina algiphila]|uniref:Uncharacterized protein n=2 Tax=Aquimarina TaxID=290174 RepID=A0A554VCG1_9FLAO|nr:hypothetical protein [Aquimarina algiphila]TSE04364.1 hypothetical protein FOF46_26420 [Aquimarina algiphila]
MKNLSQKQNVSKEHDFNKGFKDAYLHEIKTSLNDRIIDDLEEERAMMLEEPFYPKNEYYNIDQGSPSHQEGAQSAIQLVKERMNLQRSVRDAHIKNEIQKALVIKPEPIMQGMIRKELQIESDFRTGFVHGYNTQKSFPDLAVLEKDYYSKNIGDEAYQDGYIKGSEFLLKEVDKNIHTTQKDSYRDMDLKEINDETTLSKKSISAREHLTKELKLSDYMKGYVSGHARGMMEYRAHKRLAHYNIYESNSRGLPNSYEEGYKDGATFLRKEEEYYYEKEREVLWARVPPMDITDLMDMLDKNMGKEPKNQKMATPDQSIESKKAVNLDKFKQAINKYSPVQRSVDNQLKEKDHDKGMDI